MPIAGSKYAFNKTMVDLAIDRPGVYELWNATEVIYIGSSTASVRSRMQAHYSGSDRCIQGATHYKEEETPSNQAVARERQLLNEFNLVHRRLPRCNDRIP